MCNGASFKLSCGHFMANFTSRCGNGCPLPAPRPLPRDHPCPECFKREATRELEQRLRRELSGVMRDYWSATYAEDKRRAAELMQYMHGAAQPFLRDIEAEAEAYKVPGCELVRT